ncbi:MAG TPA: hypothetical protein VGD42_06205 [Lysobacter sp.]
MNQRDPKTRRDLENPDPHELNRPVPRIFLVLVAALLAWAIYYIATQAPGLGSSSTSRIEPSPTAGPASQGG